MPATSGVTAHPRPSIQPGGRIRYKSESPGRAPPTNGGSTNPQRYRRSSDRAVRSKRARSVRRGLATNHTVESGHLPPLLHQRQPLAAVPRRQHRPTEGSREPLRGAARDGVVRDDLLAGRDGRFAHRRRCGRGGRRSPQCGEGRTAVARVEHRGGQGEDERGDGRGRHHRGRCTPRQGVQRDDGQVGDGHHERQRIAHRHDLVEQQVEDPVGDEGDQQDRERTRHPPHRPCRPDRRDGDRHGTGRHAAPGPEERVDRRVERDARRAHVPEHHDPREVLAGLSAERFGIRDRPAARHDEWNGPDEHAQDERRRAPRIAPATAPSPGVPLLPGPAAEASGEKTATGSRWRFQPRARRR